MLWRRTTTPAITTNESSHTPLWRRGTRSALNRSLSSLTGGRDGDDRDLNERFSDTSRVIMQRGGSNIVRAGTRASGKAAISGGRWAAQTTAHGVTKAGKTTARVAAKASGFVARQASIATAKVTAAISAAISTAGVPLIAILVGGLAIISIVAALVSWLPSAANDQNTVTADANYPIIDDYPYKGHYNDGTSPLGYEYGNCTDFAAWRVNRDAGVSSAPWKYRHDLTPLGGNGGQWGLSGNLPGWKTTVTPQPGDIISIPAGVAILGASGGPYGHVAYIAQVNASSVLIENYGKGKYYKTNPTASQLATYIASGQAVVKHNPLGRSKATGGGDAKQYALRTLNDDTQYQCLVQLWNHESGWKVDAENPSSGAYGIPQALPGNRMASAGADWKTNGITQVNWGLQYIQQRPDYGNPCAAWSKWQSRSPHWY